MFFITQTNKDQINELNITFVEWPHISNKKIDHHFVEVMRKNLIDIKEHRSRPTRVKAQIRSLKYFTVSSSTLNKT